VIRLHLAKPPKAVAQAQVRPATAPCFQVVLELVLMQVVRSQHRVQGKLVKAIPVAKVTAAAQGKFTPVVEVVVLARPDQT
jgi:hypothetical protein